MKIFPKNLRGKQLDEQERKAGSKPAKAEKPAAKKPAKTMSQADFSGYRKGGKVKKGC